MTTLTTEAADTFVNSNRANVHSCSNQQLFEKFVAVKHKQAQVVYDFVPVLVYADSNNSFVAYYDEENAQGYIAGQQISMMLRL